MITTPTVQEEHFLTAQAADFVPARILEIELGQPLPVLSAFDEKGGQCYKQARCLVRLHGQPLGMVELQFDQSELQPRNYARHIWIELSRQINEHLWDDGLPLVKKLGPDGLMTAEIPACMQERETFFATAPFVSVIVSTRDRPEQLALCLPALLAQRYPDYEVIIVDNAPATDATAELVQQTYGNNAKLRYVREDRPGLSIGLNRGVTEAKGEILAFTDDDVVVDDYWLLELVRGFSLADGVSCVTGLVLPLELETPAQQLFEEFGGFSKGFRRRIYDMAENRPREPLYPYTMGRFGTGASMALRADFLRHVGGFDPALQCGMDISAFFQVVRQGYKLVYQPSALAYHAHRRSYDELRRQIYNYGAAVTGSLTKCILDRPLCLFELLLRIPYGLYFTLSSRSAKNQKKLAHYPQELTRIERRGMIAGPFAYIRRKRVRIP